MCESIGHRPFGAAAQKVYDHQSDFHSVYVPTTFYKQIYIFTNRCVTLIGILNQNEIYILCDPSPLTVGVKKFLNFEEANEIRMRTVGH